MKDVKSCNPTYLFVVTNMRKESNIYANIINIKYKCHWCELKRNKTLIFELSWKNDYVCGAIYQKIILNIFAKISIIVIWLGPIYTSDL